MECDRSALRVLRNLIIDADLILGSTSSPPEKRTAWCRETLCRALALADDLLGVRHFTPEESLREKVRSLNAWRIKTASQAGLPSLGKRR